MNALVAVSTGVGLGLVYYGGLWLTVRRLASGGRQPPEGIVSNRRSPQGADAPRSPVSNLFLGVSRAARLAVVGLGFYALAAEGTGAALEGLGGLWLVRGYLIHRLGGP
jgi:hypothetical protein